MVFKCFTKSKKYEGYTAVVVSKEVEDELVVTDAEIVEETKEEVVEATEEKPAEEVKEETETKEEK